MTFKNVNEIGQAMLRGDIRTFAQQNDDQQADTAEFGTDNPSLIRVCTPLEIEARRVYLAHILSTENPTVLP